MMNNDHHKIAKTKYNILNLIKNRWSPRAFNDKEIDDEMIFQIIEAASWAASAMNEQPWRYIIAQKKNKDKFEKVLNCLSDGNKIWAKNAACLIVSLANKYYTQDKIPNRTYFHDTGLANANLIIEALNNNIYTHPMGGFSAEKIINTFNLPAELEPVIVLALGYLGDPETLPEDLKKRELAPRTRKPLNEIIIE